MSKSTKSINHRRKAANLARRQHKVPLVRSDVSQPQHPDLVEAHQVMAALEWGGLDQARKTVLAMGGILDVKDYVAVRSVLHSGTPTDFFVNWIAAYGIGVAKDTEDISETLAVELAKVLRERLLGQVFGQDPRAEDIVQVYTRIKPECFYVDLPSGSRYFHTMYERDTPERRLWIEAVGERLNVTLKRLQSMLVDSQ